MRPLQTTAITTLLILGPSTFTGCGEDEPFSDTSTTEDEAQDDEDDDEPPPDVNVMGGESEISASALQVIYQAPLDVFCEGQGIGCPGIPMDLEFNPVRPKELWVVLRQPYDDEPCDEPPDENTWGPRQAGCTLLRSRVAIFADATVGSPRVEIKEDGNSWHFMRRVTSLAFGKDGTFTTVGEARTGNWLDDPLDFIGPTWWSSDPKIFAQEFTTTNSLGEVVPLNGSHLDMLHGTPFGMGVAHQWDTVYWCFNGDVGAIDRYDFVHPHEPGGHDHSDGLFHRFATGKFKRLANVPSHMVFDADETTLYVADTGNRRIAVLDTTTGEEGDDVEIPDNQIAEPRLVVGAEVNTLVEPGLLEQPSGIVLHRDALIVSDAATGLLYRFALDGELLADFDTGLGANALAGLAVGPDDRLYLVDRVATAVLRLEVDN